MALDIEFAERVLLDLELIEGLTDEDRASIVAAVTEESSRDPYYFLARYPVIPEEYAFWYDYPHPTLTALYDFDFVVSGDGDCNGRIL